MDSHAGEDGGNHVYGLGARQLLGDLLKGPVSLVDGILNPSRPTTTTPQQQQPVVTTKPASTPAQQSPKPAPTTSTPQPQPTTPKAEPAPTPTPDNKPKPAPTPAPSPEPEPETTTTQEVKPEPTPEPQPEPSPEPSPAPSPIISSPPQEEAHQSFSSEDAVPSVSDNIALPDISSTTPSSTFSSAGGARPTSGLPGLTETDSRGGNGSNGLDLTQSLALGFGLTLLVVLSIVFFFLIRRCRRKRRQQYAATALNAPPPSSSHPSTGNTTGPSPPFLNPPHDPEAGFRHIHEHHHFHNVEKSVPAYAHETSQFDRQASTAAWAQRLPPPPPEPEEDSGIIRIFRWPTMSSLSGRTTSTWPSGGMSRSLSAATQSKDVSSSSRGSRSTLSTMLWRSRKSISRRKAQSTISAAEDEVRMIPEPMPSPVPSFAGQAAPPPVPLPPTPPMPLHIAYMARAAPEQQLQQRPEVGRVKSRRRASVATVSSVGGRSIASSSVLSPTLMSFPAPPARSGTSSLSAVVSTSASARDEEPARLPATVYKPYRPGGR